MLLTVTASAADGGLSDATDLGYLLHKHPDRVHRADLPVGVAHVVYPEASPRRCTAALLLEVDPIDVVRRKGSRPDGFTLGQYVNDRPYAASSLLAVALGRVFGTALKGRCTARPELEGLAIDLELSLPAVPAPSELVTRLFTPLGWQVDATPVGPRHVGLTLAGRCTLAEALSHLYVLLPVLDGAKHYWVGPDEVDKLIRTAGGWLGAHPERELITSRYLARQRSYVAEATERLMDDTLSEDTAPADEVERRPALARQRVDAVLAELRRCGATSVVDLGCGEGRLLRELLGDVRFDRVLGVDVSAGELARAERSVERLGERQRARLTLAQGSLTYRDDRLAGFDAAVLMEVIEHLDADRLADLERVVFGHARPGAVIVTTPNVEYNPRYGLAPGELRHRDHRFELSRRQFREWAERVAAGYGYGVRFDGVGEPDAELGAPTQLAVFARD